MQTRTQNVLWSKLDNTAMLNLADLDGDGMHDSWEDSFELVPNIYDAADNLDNDGLTNLEEYVQGYDPVNPLLPIPQISSSHFNPATELNGVKAQFSLIFESTVI